MNSRHCLIIAIVTVLSLFFCVLSFRDRRCVAYDSLITAIVANDTSAVKVALDDGANVNDIPVDEGVLPLAAAAREGNVEIVRLLLDYGANINGFDGWQSALSAAADNDQTAVIEFLIARGAHGRDDALMCAAVDGKVAAVRVLLAHGANPNSGSDKGEETLLHAVEKNHHPDVAALLLRAGAK